MIAHLLSWTKTLLPPHARTGQNHTAAGLTSRHENQFLSPRKAPGSAQKCFPWTSSARLLPGASLCNRSLLFTDKDTVAFKVKGASRGRTPKPWFSQLLNRFFVTCSPQQEEKHSLTRQRAMCHRVNRVLGLGPLSFERSLRSQPDGQEVLTPRSVMGGRMLLLTA